MDIYWVRHAVSCANAIKNQHKGWLSRATEWFMAKRSRGAPNAALHPLGVQQAQNAHLYIKDIVQQHGDVVLAASCLRRAVQTAHYLLPGQPVVVLPFISEERRIGPDNDNVCSLDDLKNLPFVRKNEALLNLSMFNEASRPGTPNASAFYKFIVPKLRRNYRGKAIIIVSHSNFIKHHVLNDATADVYNTSIWKEHIAEDGTRTMPENPYPGRTVRGLQPNTNLCAYKYADVNIHSRLKIPFLNKT